MSVLSVSDEKKIIELLKSDDDKQYDKGFGILYKRKDTLMSRSKKSYPKFNKEDFIEIFEDALLTLRKKILQGKFEYLDDGALSAFLSTLIYNQCRNHLRKVDGMIKLDELTSLIPNGNNPTKSSTEPFQNEGIKIVVKILEEAIGETCQKIVTLRFYEGMKHKEIAEKLNLALGTVKNKSKSCMDELKEKMRQNPELEKYIREHLTNES